MIKISLLFSDNLCKKGKKGGCDICLKNRLLLLFFCCKGVDGRARQCHPGEQKGWDSKNKDKNTSTWYCGWLVGCLGIYTALNCHTPFSPLPLFLFLFLFYHKHVPGIEVITFSLFLFLLLLSKHFYCQNTRSLFSLIFNLEIHSYPSLIDSYLHTLLVSIPTNPHSHSPLLKSHTNLEFTWPSFSSSPLSFILQTCLDSRHWR